MSPTPLTPDHALAYLRELQPGAAEVAILGPDGALLAGETGAPAKAARALLAAGGRRSVDGSVLALAVDGRAIAARIPDAGGALAEFDLTTVVSAIDVRFV